jgi:spore maturation protein CgeB
LAPEREIILARQSGDVLDVLLNWPEERTRALAQEARRRVLDAHTAAHRAVELEGFLVDAMARLGAWRPHAAAQG